MIQDAQLLDFRSEIFVQNFADPPGVMFHDGGQLNYEFRLIAGKWFRKANDSDRLLNRSTILLDLTLSEFKLMESFRPNTRNKIRRAQNRNVSIRHEAGSEGIIDKFIEFYEPLVDRFKLARPIKKIIYDMAKANKLVCFASYECNSEPTMIDLIYVCERQAYYMFGASASRFETGTGQLLQWEIMRFLKAQGVRWYDLGGVETADPTNGIFVFKRGFGGELVHWGEQLVYQPPIHRALHLIRCNLPPHPQHKKGQRPRPQQTRPHICGSSRGAQAAPKRPRAEDDGSACPRRQGRAGDRRQHQRPGPGVRRERGNEGITLSFNRNATTTQSVKTLIDLRMSLRSAVS